MLPVRPVLVVKRGQGVQSGHDLVGEGRDLVLPAFLQWPLDTGHPDRSLGDLLQPLGLQQLIHDRDDPLPPVQLFLGWHLAGLLVGLGGALGGQDRVPGPRLQTDLAQESPGVALRLAHAARRAEDVQVGMGQVLRVGIVDVPDADRYPSGRHDLLELPGNHGAVAEFRSVIISDVHDWPPEPRHGPSISTLAHAPAPAPEANVPSPAVPMSFPRAGCIVRSRIARDPSGIVLRTALERPPPVGHPLPPCTSHAAAYAVPARAMPTGLRSRGRMNLIMYPPPHRLGRTSCRPSGRRTARSRTPAAATAGNGRPRWRSQSAAR